MDTPMSAIAAIDLTAPQEVKPTFSPSGGPPGTEVSVRMSSLRPVTETLIGFGTFGEHGFVGRALTDAQGNLAATVRIPDDALSRETYFFFVAYDDQRPRGVSDPFHVTGPDGVLRRRGRISVTGTECAVMVGDDRVTYALIGDTARLAVNEPVEVAGTISPTPAPCGQGLAIVVREIRTG
jgi:hypothetical protein